MRGGDGVVDRRHLLLNDWLLLYDGQRGTGVRSNESRGSPSGTFDSDELRTGDWGENPLLTIDGGDDDFLGNKSAALTSLTKLLVSLDLYSLRLLYGGDLRWRGSEEPSQSSPPPGPAPHSPRLLQTPLQSCSYWPEYWRWHLEVGLSEYY